MDILGVGPQELIVILIIALIVLGPKDMQKAGKTIGKWMNDLVHSDVWRLFQSTSREIRNLPTNLMREANLEEFKQMDKDLRGQSGQPLGSKPLTIGTQPAPSGRIAAPKTEPADRANPPTDGQDVNG